MTITDPVTILLIPALLFVLPVGIYFAIKAWRMDHQDTHIRHPAE